MTVGAPHAPAGARRTGTIAGMLTRATTVDRRLHALAGLGAVAALGLTASQDGDGIVLCPFRRCTGGYCPGCGLTRATGALLRGGVAASWRQHPYLLLAIAQIVAVGAWSVVDRRRSRYLLERWQTHLLTANAMALLAIWVVRLMTGAIPAPFG